jgi:hypothetical protein
MRVRVDDVADRLRRRLDVAAGDGRSRLGAEGGWLFAQVEVLLQPADRRNHLVGHLRQSGVDHQHAVAADRYDDIHAARLDDVQVPADRQHANVTALLADDGGRCQKGSGDGCDRHERSSAHAVS